jgi:hypothetical protein
MRDWPPLGIVRFSGVALQFGVEEHRVEGVVVHVTSKEKTVADALTKAAEASRVTNVMHPYLEALAGRWSKMGYAFA